MKIDFNANIDPLANAGAKPVKPREASTPTDAASFDSSARLERKLNETPDVRPDKVAFAKLLVGDVLYPPQQGIKSIANLLAISFTEDSQV